MGAPWRLLRDGVASGAWNMGVDEALLAGAARRGVCSLRLYYWDSPWLSLGYGQRPAPERLDACRAARVGVVRRVSGGRAVLHGGDLTYSVAAPSRALPAGLRPSYELLGRALLRGLLALGVPAERSQPSSQGPGRGEFDCFAIPAPDEICVGGQKLAGSAQRRMEGALLQHGSIRIWPDPPPAIRASGLRGTTATSLRELGCGTRREAIEEAVLAAFRSVLGVQLEVGELEVAEREQAHARCELSAADPLFAPLWVGSRAPQESSRVQIDDR